MRIIILKLYPYKLFVPTIAKLDFFISELMLTWTRLPDSLTSLTIIASSLKCLTINFSPVFINQSIFISRMSPLSYRKPTMLRCHTHCARTKYFSDKGSQVACTPSSLHIKTRLEWVFRIYLYFLVNNFRAQSSVLYWTWWWQHFKHFHLDVGVSVTQTIGLLGYSPPY